LIDFAEQRRIIRMASGRAAMVQGCVLIVAAIACIGTLSAADDSPVELGKVVWLRDYAEALKTAAAGSKPIMVLFMEVPG
jgi:hypothetical protein